MSSEHKRPMVAFVVVLALAVLVLAGVARTEAMRGILGDAARKASVAGTRLLPESRPTVASVSQPMSQLAVQPPAAGSRVAFTRAKQGTDRRTGHDRRDRTISRSAATRHERSPHARHRPPGHTRSWVGPPAHAQAHGLHKSTPPGHAKAKANGKGKAKAKGHRKHHQGKGHGKARGHRRH